MRYHHQYPNVFTTEKRPGNKEWSHSGRDITIARVGDTKCIFKVENITRILTKCCTTCRIRNRKYNFYREGRVHPSTLGVSSPPGTVIFLDLEGPFILQTWTNKFMNTRANVGTTVKYWAMLGVCSFTRAVLIELVNSTGSGPMAQGLQSLFIRFHNTPKLIFTDAQSSLVALSKIGKLMVKVGNVIKIEGLSIVISPKGEDGHQFISPVERRVRSVKESLNSLNMSRTQYDVCALSRLLRVCEYQLNNVPSGLRTKGQYRHSLNPDFLDRVICLNTFLHPWPSRPVASFMYLNKIIDNYLQDLKKHQDSLTSILEAYFVSLTKQLTKANEDKKDMFDPHVNDIVTFKTKSNELGGRYTLGWAELPK